MGALLCRGSSITLPWQQHYSALAMALLCLGMGITLLWQQCQSDVAMSVCCKEQQQQKRLMRMAEWQQCCSSSCRTASGGMNFHSKSYAAIRTAPWNIWQFKILLVGPRDIWKKLIVD